MKEFILMVLEYTTTRFFFLVPMLAGLVTFLVIVRHTSMGTGITHNDAKEGIKNGNMAMAVYFGLRGFSIAIVVAGVSIAGAIAAKL